MDSGIAQHPGQVAEPVGLGQRRDVGVEIGVLAEQRQQALQVGLPIIFAVAGAVGGDHGYSLVQRAAKPQRVGQAVIDSGEGFLVAGMGQERQLQLPQPPVKRCQPRIGGIDVLDRGEPLQQHSPLLGGSIKPFQRIAATGVDAGAEQQVRVLAALPSQKLVGDMDLGRRFVQSSLRIDHAVHCQHHRRRNLPRLAQAL